MADVKINQTAANAEDALPLVTSVMGHRDLVPDEVPAIRARIPDLFTA